MDTSLFIDIIESVGGITFLRRDFRDGVHIMFYEGRNGKLVLIDTTEEEISATTCKQYLRQMGLDDLIQSLFP